MESCENIDLVKESDECKQLAELALRYFQGMEVPRGTALQAFGYAMCATAYGGGVSLYDFEKLLFSMMEFYKLTREDGQ